MVSAEPAIWSNEPVAMPTHGDSDQDEHGVLIAWSNGSGYWIVRFINGRCSRLNSTCHLASVESVQRFSIGTS